MSRGRAGKKAEEIVLLDMRGISSFCDFFLICNGSSEPHLKAIAGSVEMRLKEHGRMPRGRDILAACGQLRLKTERELGHR